MAAARAERKIIADWLTMLTQTRSSGRSRITDQNSAGLLCVAMITRLVIAIAATTARSGAAKAVRTRLTRFTRRASSS